MTHNVVGIYWFSSIAFLFRVLTDTRTLCQEGEIYGQCFSVSGTGIIIRHIESRDTYSNTVWIYSALLNISIFAINIDVFYMFFVQFDSGLFGASK